MTVTHTIGATGRDFSTIESWEVSTSTALITNYIGECYHDVAVGTPTFSMSSSDNQISMVGASNLSATAYRHLKAASGQKYDPVYGTGVWIEREIGTASEAVGICIYIQEEYFRLTDMAIIDTGSPTSGFSTGVRVDAVDNVQISRCYIKWATGYSDGTAGTAYSDAVRIDSGATNVTVDNCIIVGGGGAGNRGCTIGIRFDSSSGTNKAIHNTVIDVKGYREDVGSTNRGISGSGTSGARVVNNVCINCSTQDADTVISSFDFFNLSTDSRNNISSDSSAGYVVDGNSVTNAVKSELFVSVVNNDFRNLSSAPTVGAGFASLTTEFDFAGNERSQSIVDIGAHEGYLIGFEGPPTEVIASIGSSKDYGSISAWEAATDNNLIEENEIQIGELYDQEYSVATEIVVSGAITEYPRRRILRVAEGNEYDPTAGTGARVLHAGGYTGSTIVIQERDFELQGPILFDFVGTSMAPAATTTGLVQVEDADGVILDRLYVTGNATTSLNNLIGIRVSGGSGGIVRNCVIWGHNGADQKSINAGIVLAGTDAAWKVLNNSVYGVDRSGTTSIGFVALGGGTASVFANNISIGGDFDWFVGSQAVENNISGDGTGTITSKTAAEVFADAPGSDFELAEASPALLAGADYLEYVPTDMSGTGRRLPMTIGAFESAKVYPQPPTIDRTQNMATLFEITRVDGTVIRLTDCSSMLRAFGYEWTPNVMRPTARRTQGGLTPSDFDQMGVVDSDLITQADLLDGKYSDASVREYIVDHKYPWLKPIGQHRYRLGRVKFDRGHWEAEASSMISKLQVKRGRLIGRLCDVGEFGGPRCNATFTLFSGTIDSVKRARMEFYVNALSPSTTDWFAIGEMTMLGNKLEVRSNSLVDVNLLSEPEDLSAWTTVDSFTTLNSGGGPDSNDSYDVETTAATGGLKLQQGTWADRNRLVLSVYVDRPGGDSRIIRLALWEGTTKEHFVEFFWDGSTWQGGTVEDTAWGHRLSFVYEASGTETGDLYAQIMLGESSGELLELALPQLEEGADAATKWVDTQRSLVTLAYPTKTDMVAGTAFTLKPGCDRRSSTCKDKHNNLINYQGFPTVPGTKKSLSTPLS